MRNRISKRVALLVELIGEANPLQSKFLRASLEDTHDAEMEELDKYIAYVGTKGLTPDYLAACYDLIVKDTLREQIYFQRHKRYRYSTFAEVADSVYFDDEYMRKYMHGLAITAYLWPNHRQLHRFFAKTIPQDQEGDYLEIGPGHGMFMMTAMHRSAYTNFDGIDLSPTSVAMTQALLEDGAFGTFDNFHVYQQDFLDESLERNRYSAVVMGEVLEHVEDPALFLQRIYEVSTSDAYVFITTPINAPAIDHIYLFRSYEEIETIVTKAGFRIDEHLMAPYPGKSVDESIADCLPINVAMVLRK